MLRTERKICFRSSAHVSCFVAGANEQQCDLPDNFLHSDSDKKTYTPAALTCVGDSRLFYKTVLIRWVLFVMAWVVLVIATTVLVVSFDSWWWALPLVVASARYGDNVLSFPDGTVVDREGNVLYAWVGWLHVPGKFVIKLH